MWTEVIQHLAKMNERLKIHQLQRSKCPTAFFIHSALNSASTLVSLAAQRSVSLFAYQMNYVISLVWSLKHSTVSAARFQAAGGQKQGHLLDRCSFKPSTK